MLQIIKSFAVILLVAVTVPSSAREALAQEALAQEALAQEALTQDKDPLSERERDLMGIAASCAAFYQSAMFELDLPVESNEDKRQAFLEVFSTFAKRGRSHREFDADFQRYIVGRTVEVSTIIQQDREKAGAKVLENLPKCDDYLLEMKTAAGLE